MTLIKMDYITVGEQFKDKEDLFRRSAEKALKLNVITDKQMFLTGLNERENEMSTCFEKGIAIPHCRNNSVRNAAVLITRSSNPIKWDDAGNIAQFIIMLAVPNEGNSTHIKILSSIARKLVDEQFSNKIVTLDSKEEIFNCFKDIELEV